MVTIAEVQHWLVVSGVGHAVGFVYDYHAHTICGTLFWGARDAVQPERPRRICRQCRERLKKATIPEG